MLCEKPNHSDYYLFFTKIEYMTSFFAKKIISVFYKDREREEMGRTTGNNSDVWRMR